MCEREEHRNTDDILFEAGIALNHIALGKELGTLSESAVERGARLLADMPEEALKSLLRGRNGEFDTNREVPEAAEAAVHCNPA